MGESSQEFLAQIGPRPLTHEEARQFQILRLKEGQGLSMAMRVIELLCAEAQRTRQQELNAAVANDT